MLETMCGAFQYQQTLDCLGIIYKMHPVMLTAQYFWAFCPVSTLEAWNYVWSSSAPANTRLSRNNIMCFGKFDLNLNVCFHQSVLFILFSKLNCSCLIWVFSSFFSACSLLLTSASSSTHLRSSSWGTSQRPSSCPTLTLWGLLSLYRMLSFLSRSLPLDFFSSPS